MSLTIMSPTIMSPTIMTPKIASHRAARVSAIALAVALLCQADGLWTSGRAEGAEGAIEAWRTSPFHGVPNAATGLPIPCLCRYKGTSLPLGAEVCLTTVDGPRIARCDLLLNNTTWVPTATPCLVNSRNQSHGAPGLVGASG
jgi:hypothetical protein